jgi:hypothetical protein
MYEDQLRGFESKTLQLEQNRDSRWVSCDSRRVSGTSCSCRQVGSTDDARR